MNTKLLLKVKRHILAEPKRIDMDIPVSTSEWRHLMPPCGTVGCIAGWTVILANRKGREAPTKTWERFESKEIISDYTWQTVRRHAIRLLRLTDRQATVLFHVPQWPQEFLDAYEKAKRPSTRAKVTAGMIYHFIKTRGLAK